jgi:hypothetical protein
VKPVLPKSAYEVLKEEEQGRGLPRLIDTAMSCPTGPDWQGAVVRLDDDASSPRTG